MVSPLDNPLDRAFKEIRSYLIRCPKTTPLTARRYILAVCREHKLTIEAVRQHISQLLDSQDDQHREALARVEEAFAEHVAQ